MLITRVDTGYCAKAFQLYYLRTTVAFLHCAPGSTARYRQCCRFAMMFRQGYCTIPVRARVYGALRITASRWILPLSLFIRPSRFLWLKTGPGSIPVASRSSKASLDSQVPRVTNATKLLKILSPFPPFPFKKLYGAIRSQPSLLTTWSAAPHSMERSSPASRKALYTTNPVHVRMLMSRGK